MSVSPRWKQRPKGSTWGDFGPDDQFGRMNLVTPEKVKQAVAEVREGVSFCLSLPLDYPGGNVLNPRRHPPLLRPTLRGNKANFNYALAADDPERTDVVNDDLTIMHLQYSTQWAASSIVPVPALMQMKFSAPTSWQKVAYSSVPIWLVSLRVRDRSSVTGRCAFGPMPSCQW